MASLNEFLEITTSAAGTPVIRCTRCGYDLCPATENHKLHALMHEGPVQEAGPHVNPYHLGGDKFVFRQFYCPSCLALINTEVALRGETILWDVQLKV
jgi:N-methylhydantoinase B